MRVMKTFTFFSVDEKMPVRYKESDCSDDLLISDNDGDIVLGHFNLKENKWFDSASWDEYYGYGEIENVKMWSPLSILVY